MSNHKVHFSSIRQNWRTPKRFYEELDKEFHFDFDPCPGGVVTWENGGLNIEWGKVSFCNPPYSDIARWVAKAWREAEKGKTVVLLIPSRTDTAWWHDFVMRGEIRFIRGRLKFDDQKNSAPFPSAVVVFNNAGDNMKSEMDRAVEVLMLACDKIKTVDGLRSLRNMLDGAIKERKAQELNDR